MKSRIFLGKRARTAMIAGILAVALIVGLIFCWFSTATSKNEKRQIESQLMELSKAEVHTVSAVMQGSMMFVQGVATMVSHLENPTSPKALSILTNVLDTTNMDNLGVLLRDGTFHSARLAQPVEVYTQWPFLRDLGDAPAVSQVVTTLVSQTEAVLISAPIRQNGEIVAHLLGSYLSQDIADLVNTTSFDGAGYAYIIQPDGTFVAHSSNPYAAVPEASFWALSQFPFERGYSYEKIYDDIQNGRSGFTEFTPSDGVLRYASYMPVGINNWYVVSLVPSSALNTYAIAANNNAILLTVLILIVFVGLAVLVLVWQNHSRKELARINRELQLGSEQLRIAVSHVACVVFTYDLKKDVLQITKAFDDYAGAQRVENALEEEVRRGTVHPGDAEIHRAIYRDILGGKPASYGKLRLRVTRNQEYKWYKFTLTRILDERGDTAYAVGTLEDIEEQQRNEYGRIREAQYRKAMLSAMVASYEADLTSNTLMEAEGEWLASLPAGTLATYDDLVDYCYACLIHPNDRSIFRDTFCRHNLLAALDKGQQELSLEYRRKMGEKYRWVRGVGQVVVDMITGANIVLLYISDINESKRQELSFRRKAERDPLTKLFNRTSCAAVVEQHLHESDADALHAFLIVDLDDFKRVNDTMGHQFGDAVLRLVASCLRSLFRGSDVVGRLGGDEFIVFIKDIRTQAAACKKAAQVNQAVAELFADKPHVSHLSCSIGLAMVQGDCPFAEMYGNADIALYHAKAKGKGQYVVYQENTNS